MHSVRPFNNSIQDFFSNRRFPSRKLGVSDGGLSNVNLYICVDHSVLDADRASEAWAQHCVNVRFLPAGDQQIEIAGQRPLDESFEEELSLFLWCMLQRINYQKGPPCPRYFDYDDFYKLIYAGLLEGTAFGGEAGGRVWYDRPCRDKLVDNRLEQAYNGLFPAVDKNKVELDNAIRRILSVLLTHAINNCRTQDSLTGSRDPLSPQRLPWFVLPISEVLNVEDPFRRIRFVLTPRYLVVLLRVACLVPCQDIGTFGIPLLFIKVVRLLVQHSSITRGQDKLQGSFLLHDDIQLPLGIT